MSITSDTFIEISASNSSVWHALTDPALIKQWFFGTSVESTWNVGDPIRFYGEWQGQSYEDKGILQQVEVGKLLEYTHLSSRTGQADVPENYELVAFTLSENDGKTTVSIHEENLPSIEARDRSIGLWNAVLGNLKNVVEHTA